MRMEVEAKAPGKVILTGEHAVVHGYAAVAASLGLYTRCHVKRAIDTAVLQSDTLIPNSTSEKIISKLKCLIAERHIPEATNGIASGVMAFLFMYSSIIGLFPLTVSVTSDLPVGAGLGSSASFCVSIAAALLNVVKLSAIDYSHSIVDNISNGNVSLDLDESNQELINKWAFEGEKIIHGRPSGIDNIVSTFGHIVRVKNGNLSRLHESIPLKILLTNTKVGRNTKALVATVGERVTRHPKAMIAIFEAIDAVTDEIVEALSSVLRWETCRCEQEGKLEDLIGINQGLLQSIGVSHPSIENICRTTQKYQLRSKLTGAGGGGCVLTLIPYQITSKTLSKVKSDLESEGYNCFEAAIGCPGVQVTAKILQ